MSGLTDSKEVLERFHGALVLVGYVARQVRNAIGSQVPVEDLESFGREGLLDAARRFDPERGIPFRAYANLRIRGAVYDGVRRTMPLPRRVHERLRGLSAAREVSAGAAEGVYAAGSASAGADYADRVLGEHLASMATAMALGMISTPAIGDHGELVSVARDASPEQALGQQELMALVRSAIDELPREEAELVRRHYLGGERFDHVAAELGLSKSWASRLHTRAIDRLAKRLRPTDG